MYFLQLTSFIFHVSSVGRLTYLDILLAINESQKEFFCFVTCHPKSPRRRTKQIFFCQLVSQHAVEE